MAPQPWGVGLLWVGMHQGNHEGNGLAGSRACAGQPPVVTSPLAVLTVPDESAQNSPAVLTARALTRAMFPAGHDLEQSSTEGAVWISWCLYLTLFFPHLAQGPGSRAKAAFWKGVDGESAAQGYLLRGELQGRKWLPLGENFVVPTKFC